MGNKDNASAATMSGLANRKYPNTGGWQDRHDTEWRSVGAGRVSHGACIAAMLKSWQGYAIAHKARFDVPLGEDYVLGAEWARIGGALRGLLNGLTDNLDCGTVDAFILNTAKQHGITEDQL